MVLKGTQIYLHLAINQTNELPKSTQKSSKLEVHYLHCKRFSTSVLTVGKKADIVPVYTGYNQRFDFLENLKSARKRLSVMGGYVHFNVSILKFALLTFNWKLYRHEFTHYSESSKLVIECWSLNEKLSGHA